MNHSPPATPLRVLIANERVDRLALLARVIEELGHEIVAQEVDVGDVAAVTARLRPDLALVGLGDDAEHALNLVSEIVRDSFCPVIALIRAYDAAWIEEEARRGIFAYIVDARPEEIQSAIDIALGRFLEHAELQGAFAQRESLLEQQQQLIRARQQLVLELHDGILQQLAVAALGLEIGNIPEPLAAVRAAVEQAKSIVNGTIAELIASGVSVEEILHDSVAKDD